MDTRLIQIDDLARVAEALTHAVNQAIEYQEQMAKCRKERDELQRKVDDLEKLCSTYRDDIARMKPAKED